MLRDTLHLLSTDDFKNISENIEIAKGKHELKHSFKDKLKQAIRNRKWLKRK